jgi:predicted flap endonuclease-1-like 5' DNA nuclease
MPTLISVEGIGPVNARKLKRAKINSLNKLLMDGATPKGRKEIAKKAGFSSKTILEWVNRADLFRVRGIAEEYSDLLEVAGVDTVVELARRKAPVLLQKMADANAKKKIVRKLPAKTEVARWIRQAAKLPRVVKY